MAVMVISGPTWRGTVQRIDESRFSNPELMLELDAWRDSPYMPLPRAGQIFWLVDDATFKRLIGDTE